ncbi:hypothetical protein BS78_03G058400 [Paspalum vaginatum]|nr:hypothetical protein BS78_03G058400 [Paspalum vaginatum]
MAGPEQMLKEQLELDSRSATALPQPGVVARLPPRGPGIGARARGEDALRAKAIDWCRGHLGVARLLLGHQGVPGAHRCVSRPRCVLREAARRRLSRAGQLSAPTCA